MRSETHGMILNTSDYPSGGQPQGIVVPTIDTQLGQQAIEDAHSYTGTWVAIRRKIRPEDGVARCSTCYDDVHEQSINPACTDCWGTTYENGYFPTQITKAIFHSMRENIELTKTGLVRVLVPEVSIGPNPAVKDGDLIVRINYNVDNGQIISTSERFWIKDVQKIEIAPDYNVIGQRFSVTEVQYGDPIWNLPI